LRAEVEDDKVVHDAPFLISPSLFESSGVHCDLASISTLQQLDAPLFICDVEVDTAIFGVGLVRENRKTVQLKV
jgi:hypothetical protein